MRRFAASAALSLLPLLVLAACSPPAPAPTPTAAPAVVIDNLTFESSELAARFRALDVCAVAEAGPNWTARPYARIGNFISARWCGPGVPAGDCESGRETQPAGNELRVISLSTLFFPSAPNNVFGLSFSARYAPAATGWEARVSYDAGGRGILGDGYQIDLRAVPYARDALRPDANRGVTLGSSITYRVADTPVEYATGTAQAEEFARAIASPDGLRSVGLALLEGLRTRVESVIMAHEARRCVYGTPPGGGVPPACAPRVLTAGEEQAELTGARAWIDAQSALLRDNAGPMYAAVLKAFPFDRCWQ